MEFCFVNLVRPGDKVIVCRNGVFGGRMIENVERCGGTAIVVEDEWGSPIDPQKVEDAFRQNPGARILAFVHAETSTGDQSDAKTLLEIAHKHDALAIVDAVTSLGGTPVLVDEVENRCGLLARARSACRARPGLSPVSFSERMVADVKSRKDKIHSWFMDAMTLCCSATRGASHAHLSSHGADELAVRVANRLDPCATSATMQLEKTHQLRRPAPACWLLSQLAKRIDGGDLH